MWKGVAKRVRSLQLPFHEFHFHLRILFVQELRWEICWDQAHLELVVNFKQITMVDRVTFFNLVL